VKRWLRILIPKSRAAFIDERAVRIVPKRFLFEQSRAKHKFKRPPERCESCAKKGELAFLHGFGGYLLGCRLSKIL
jgi:hypothetical protein